MTEENTQPKAEEAPPAPEVQQTAPPPEVPPAAVEPSQMIDANEIADGKAFAILSYALSLVGIPFFLVPLIMRNNEYSLFHSKQCLIVWIALVATALVNVIPCLGQIVWLVVAVFMLVVIIIGLIGATKDEMKPLPLVGQWAIDWFKGIKKQ